VDAEVAMSVAPDLPQEYVLDAEAIRSRPRDPMDPGVSYTLLWRADGNSVGLLWIEPGAAVPEHTHAAAEHHVWVVEGRAGVDGRDVGPGAYWHVPAGVPHRVAGLGPSGCTLFYLYLRR
jgi:mannose-6-phosphate isomerase-like protein (cupin superfamily)